MTSADTFSLRNPSSFCVLNHAQDVLCDASAGTFTLIFDGAETDSIRFDADATEIESLLEELSTVSDVDVSFPSSVTQACQQSPAAGSAGFKVTFVDVVNYRGDVPEMTSNIDNLEVLHHATNRKTTHRAYEQTLVVPEHELPLMSQRYFSITATHTCWYTCTRKCAQYRSGVKTYALWLCVLLAILMFVPCRLVYLSSRVVGGPTFRRKRRGTLPWPAPTS